MIAVSPGKLINLEFVSGTDLNASLGLTPPNVFTGANAPFLSLSTSSGVKAFAFFNLSTSASDPTNSILYVFGISHFLFPASPAAIDCC